MTEKPIRAWQLSITLNRLISSRERSRRKLRDAMRGFFVDFVATDAVDAAPKVLAILKARARRVRNRRGAYIVDVAAPHGWDSEQGKNFLVGDEMLRLREGYNDLTKLLRIQDPLEAFNVGYGETCKPLREVADLAAA